MKIDSQKYHRRSMRLQGYDYSSPGAYFITIITFHREYLFGEMVDAEMRMNQYGKIVEHTSMDLPSHYPQVTLGTFVIMPNHVHGIVFINVEDNGYSRGGSLSRVEGKLSNSVNNDKFIPYINKTRPYESGGLITHDRMMQYSLPEIVRAFKSFSARRINQMRNMHRVAVWQRSYYDHIIRSEKDLHNIWEYTQTNPQIWQEDQLRLSTVGAGLRPAPTDQ